MIIKLRWQKKGNQFYTNKFTDINKAIARYNWLKGRGVNVTWWME